MRYLARALLLILTVSVTSAEAAADFQNMTNEQLLEQFLASESPKKSEAELRGWIDGFVDAFASVYRFEMQDGDEGHLKTPGCVHEQNKEDLYLLLMTAGAVEEIKDLPVTKTMYLMLRLGCKELAEFAPLPTWIVNGGYDQLGIEVPQ